MAGIASVENGKKGGRPKGAIAKSTREAIELRNFYVEKAREHAEPIATALIEKAVTGDVSAIKEFNDRAFGKAPQSIDLTSKSEITLISPELKEIADRLRNETD